jgi:hypothetical protein
MPHLSSDVIGLSSKHLKLITQNRETVNLFSKELYFFPFGLKLSVPY